MKYESLKKYFHIDEQKCNEVYKRRFESDSANRLGIMINEMECFYIINDEIMNLIGNIYSINMWFDKAFYPGNLPLSAKNYIIISSLVEEIKSSNRIEGIYSTRKEINDIILTEKPKKYKRFYGMVNKYQKIANNEFPDVETSSDIRNLYDEILLKDVIEEKKSDKPDGVIFRANEVEISSGIKVIHKGVNGEKNIIEMMDRSLRILNDENINILIRVAVFHYLFEYIHPFYNGNGRMGRFLVSGYLSKYLNILCAFQLSIACLHNAKKYYDAFELTNDIRNKSDLTPFIIYFLDIYYDGLKELKEKMENTSDIYKNLKNKIEINFKDKYYDLMILLLQATLFGSDGFTMSELVKLSDTTEQTLRKMIKKINDNHLIIEIKKVNKPYIYRIDIDILSRLEE